MNTRIRSTVSLMILCASFCTGESLAEPAKGSAIRFTDVTADSGIDFTMTSGKTPSRYILDVDGGGVALFDYDRDGDLDLCGKDKQTKRISEFGPSIKVR